MENILKEIDLKIKEIASNKEIDTQKLQELIYTRNRLKGYITTSISQIQGFNDNHIITPNNLPIQTFQGVQRNNTIYDIIMDMANIHLKNQTKQFENRNINDLIYYHKFISELNPSTDKETNNERFEIKNEIEELILKEFRNTINERKIKNKEQEIQEKDKIIETKIELSSEVIQT